MKTRTITVEQTIEQTDVTKECTATIKKKNGANVYYVEVRHNPTGLLLFTTGLSAAHKCEGIKDGDFDVEFTPNPDGNFTKYFTVWA
jgi:hypothetical protein